MKKSEVRRIIREELEEIVNEGIDDKKVLDQLMDILKKRWGHLKSDEVENYFEEKSKQFLKDLKKDLNK